MKTGDSSTKLGELRVSGVGDPKIVTTWSYFEAEAHGPRPPNLVRLLAAVLVALLKASSRM